MRYRILICLLFFLRASHATTCDGGFFVDNDVCTQCPENSFTPLSVPSTVLNKDECREAKGQLNMDGSHSGANSFDEYAYNWMPYGCSFYYNRVNIGIDARILWNSDTTNANSDTNRRICKQNGAYVAMNNSDDECGHSFTECTPWTTGCNAGYYFTTGTSTSDATCTPCPSGTYQPDDNSLVAQCTEWSVPDIAFAGKMLYAFATSSADHQWIALEDLTLNELSKVSSSTLKAAYEASHECPV